MPSQITDTATIEHEKHVVRDAAGLSDSATIEFNDRGWDSRVYAFDNGRYFFKFPRSEKVQARYKYEIAAIKFVCTLDTKMVAPKILWEHPDNAYFGYEGVQGASVNTLLDTFDKHHIQTIGEAIGDFLMQFHALDLPGARIMTLEDEAKQIQRWYENGKAAARQWFTDNEQKKLHRLVYDTWPTRLTELGSELVLSHGDLHFENILYGEDGTVGIIDFGDVAYYDRSKDFLEIADNAAIFAAALSVYGSHDAHLRQKIAIRQEMIQVLNFGFHAGKQDQKNMQLTADKIKAKL